MTASLAWRTTLLFFLAFPQLALGQTDTIPDTLDWKGYFPLQIGNTWEYHYDNFPQIHLGTYSSNEIVGDTTIDGQQYVVMARETYNLDVEPLAQDSIYLRYDTTAQTVVQLHNTGRHQGEYSYRGACNLNAPFPASDNEIEYTCPNGEGDVVVAGEYLDRLHRIGTDSIYVAAEKGFLIFGQGVTFLHGLGIPGWGSEGGYSSTILIYANIDGQSYGSSEIANSTHIAPPILTSPADSATVGVLNGHVHPHLVWQESDRATHYQVQLAADSTGFEDPLFDFTIEDGSNNDICSWQEHHSCIYLAHFPGFIQWRVRGLSKSDTSAWSTVRHLHVISRVHTEREAAIIHGLRIESLYPNPANAHITAIVTTDRLQEGSIRVYDVLGRVVYRAFNAELVLGETLVTMNVSTLPAGMYLLSVSTARQHVSQHFQVVR